MSVCKIRSVLLAAFGLSLFCKVVFSDYDEVSLLRRHTRAADSHIQCCPQGEQGRCFERLVRSPNGEVNAAVCAATALTGTPLENIGRDDPRRCGDEVAGFARSTLGLQLGQYLERGWWETGAPPSFYNTDERNIVASYTAMSSQGCEDYQIDGVTVPGWREARERCSRTGYTPVRVYMSLGDTNRVRGILGQPLRQEVLTHDPLYYFRQEDGNRRVEIIRATTPQSLKRQLARLAMNCRLIDFGFVDSHSIQGGLSFGNGEGREIGSFLRWTSQPCVLAPRAQVQFTGCSIICRPFAEQLRQTIQNIYSDNNYLSRSGSPGVNQLRVLINSSMGYSANLPALFDTIINQFASVYRVGQGGRSPHS